MLDEDLRHRARRLMAGDRRVADLDRLFLGLRARAGFQACFREIGDFVAHRDTREKGLITQVGRDVFTSVDVWSSKMRGREPTWADIARAAHANFRLASDEQLKAGCGCKRSSAKQRLQRALVKVEQGKRPTDKEVQTLDYLGNRFIWKPAFTAAQLAAEFIEVLLRTGITKPGDGGFSEETRTFLALYAIALMHGSAIILADGRRGRLFAGFANRQRHLEVKVEIIFNELSKPLMAPICLFLTDLSPEENCSPTLLQSSDPVLPSHWNFPLDLGPDGKLDRVG
ncbi:hypothetical protein [Nitratireductor sp. StC3]|uniref:hypothetical protein n=1 Tax=Nitratireductor sp. StC3 TaxID=2126741 RepID=UPI000D0D006B|nr:hypothetical protein [Nitratireductor sp. StC3]PSM17365.1 hypothetical protein C7T96_15870 [Nitratireductor sp. StC3]